MRRPLGVLALLVLVVLAGCTGTGTVTTDEPTTTDQTPTTTTAAPTPVHPADPETDRLGWEEGYWYNETIRVDQSDGLNDTEREAVVARAMARVEAIRDLEFNRSVPVEVISREEHRNRTNRSYADVPVNATLHQNVKFEATFMIGEGGSAVEQQEQNRASSVLGYYSPGADRIVIVSEDTDSPQIDEITLAQELFHALQEHRFNVSAYEANTEETHNARAGIIEGDANYVDYLYERRFGDALVEQSDGDGAGSDAGSEDESGAGPHVGMLALRLQPYSDGPVFVQQIHERGGWDAVDAVYDAPPQSTEQTIHPARYRNDTPTTVTIADRSDANWTVPDLGNGSIDYAQFGEAGMYVMLWYPSYAASVEAGEPRDVVIPSADFFSPDQRAAIDRYDYEHRYTAGWDGDRLLPYVTNQSAATGETGYVWKSVWDSPAEAAEFVSGYRALLEHHGAEPVPGRANTYRIPDGAFADAFFVEQSGDGVVIVNAPTVGELSAVRAGAGTLTTDS